MENYSKIGYLQVAEELYEFINKDVIPGTGMSSEEFWTGLGDIVKDLAPKNEKLLNVRDDIQTKLNEWHKSNQNFDFNKYKAFLKDLTYLESEVDDFSISTTNVDDEIAVQAGPQLVVPVNNGRYAINAANARWGSLYDALYGTDAISEDNGADRKGDYNPVRGDKVIAYAKRFLDKTVPLKERSYSDIVQYSIEQGMLKVHFKDSDESVLLDQIQFVGYQGSEDNPSAILLKNNDVHLEIQIDREDPIGQTDAAGVKDVYMESAITTIMDFEDSVTAVDAEDKVLVYRNFLGLIKGDLKASFQKGSKTISRTLNTDREYISPDGESFSLRGRSLMFARNVGHLMTTNAVLDQDGNEIPEGILDSVITGLIAKHDVLKNGKYQNSSKDSIYIVKPKMHGSKEVAFANELFNRTEDLLKLDRNTIKIGVMDEERRTTLNLRNCINEVKERIVFINTGFLDRTGDEIHTSMEAGPVIRKSEMKNSTWLQSYEKSNVQQGLQTGFSGKAQIGKGMWAMPDLMADMLAQKGSQLQAGANTAWVPSPTAATLHALHYHEVNVPSVQEELAKAAVNYQDDILEIPISKDTNWSEKEIQEELDNNAQGILGYVVRWVEHGVGCSKVPDIRNIELMEDRATLRISSQHVANWLHHGICTKDQVMETMKRMAKVVDEQNAGDPEYRAMATNYDESIAFQAACDLVFEGFNQPNGYTEPILHRRRQEAKAKVYANK
ncbi:malate synthase G [Pseudalkalibacillus hwajinpoensis]|uniref:Malate synthase G n=1 Tax=Guptibacillus hwajinpoensis TaxID=208199 RepID=A0A4U1MKW8_9BACL|nr:malate synthase G [Pseudalkalibacillus hwajinpoensis]TKD71351.1 malate synthase G [Pseudalkalibacillus hwajinpoensis]